MRNRVTILTAGLAAVAVAAAAWATVGPFIVRKDAAQLQSQTTSLAEQVTAVCAKGGAAAAELGPNGTCAKAAELQNQPPVAQSAATDAAQLRQAAKTAVAEYCAAPNHPCRGTDGQSPNFDLIVDAVLARVPAPKNGQDGRDAPIPDWPAQIVAYCGQVDEPCRGAKGDKGEKGDPPSCMAEATQCRGADGQPPAGWTTSYSDGTTETCSRAAPFDPAAPRDTCTRAAPPSSTQPAPLIRK